MEFYCNNNRDFEKNKNRNDDYLRSNEIINEEQYWLDVYKDEIPVLNMPTDYVRPSIQSYEEKLVNLKIAENIVLDLKKLAIDTETTMDTLLISAFYILLSKYTGQEDIIIGVPIFDSASIGIQVGIDLSENILAIRNQPEGSLTYLEFLEAVKANLLKAYRNQNYQFEQLIDKLKMKRDMSRHPLFDVAFNSIDRSNEENINVDDLALEKVVCKDNIPKCDLIFNAISNNNNGLSIVINYNSNLFTHQTIERFSCHLVQILKSITKNKKNYISDINVMTEEEINQILFDFNKTDYTYPKINTICELFEAQVKKNPTKIAVVFEDNTLTYMELNKKANSLARNLREQGVRPDSIVSLLVEKSIEMVVGILGVLKAGGAYLPIDPSYPKDRIEYILKDSRSEVLLTNIKLNNKIDFKYKIIDLLDEELYGRETEDLDKLHTSRNLAYVIYTSGTTGEPKGVMVEHKGVINLINSSKKKFNLNSNKKILQFASIAFDASAWEIYMGILLGAEVHVISKNLAMDICKLNTYIKRNEINITLLPPFVANEIEIEDTELEVIITGGSESNRSLASRVGKKLNYVNAYGPTENSICTTMWKYEGTINKSVPIGKAVDNNKIYILDKLNNILPIGIAGELCISGDGLARGYLNKNELTCQKFIDNPFEAGTKMYKTGDLARWLPDGNIEYLGRKDNQVKIRGYRIELGEIENKLLENNNIKEAVVLVKENKRKYLCAYIVSDKTVEELDIKEYLKKKLPEYMIPAHFVLLKSMPLTPNGKINNRLLPEPDTNNLNANYQAPRNEIEKTIAEIWGKALEIEKIGVSENFFDLGGDSLSIVIMLHLLNREFGKEIFLDDFLRNPTISYLATLIAAEKNKEDLLKEIEESLQEKLEINVKLRIHDYNFRSVIVLFTNSNHDEIKRIILDNYSEALIPDYIVPLNDFKNYNERGILDIFDSISMNSEIEDKINDDLREQYREINKKIALNKVINQFPCSSSQNKFLMKKRFSNIVCTIPFDKIISSSAIEYALINTINQNSMLRSKIGYAEGRYYNFESDRIHNLEINVIDLSSYDDASINLVKKYIQRNMESMNFGTDIIDKVLYSFILIKVSEKKYELLMMFNHMIFDGASMFILKRQIYSHLNSYLFNKKTKNSNVKPIDYLEYVDEQMKNTNKEKIIQYKEGLEFKEIYDFILKRKIDINDNSEYLVDYFFEYSIQENHDYGIIVSERMECLSFWIALQMCKIIFDRNQFVLRMTRNARNIGGKDFGDVIGDFHISIPVKVDADDQDINTSYNKVENSYKKNYIEDKVFIDNIAYGEYEDKELGRDIKKVYDSLDFGFNYTGEYSESEYDNIRTIISSKFKKHKRYFITAFSYKNKMCFICRLPKNYDLNKLQKIKKVQMLLK
ncbi:TPA: amino acid adenylation domain-containing protein [Bacillus cereus]|uniref:non-ribosomal peptide synthetase n=1 Tax=Bacillus thuringiensis TaxID=1428 RepID=UPI000BFB27CA|nr:non-ribosomal peptide synthetase [Bacillus thuringiensis]PGN40922.1 hypothetical protein CN968_16575 [Bacillus thuringiensis]HDR4555895.1 amino acid adenylation domain-containing protein [Bacillus cereus]